jgi:hypothetical protein
MVQSQYTRRSPFFGLYLGLNFTLKRGATRQKLLISPDWKVINNTLELYMNISKRWPYNACESQIAEKHAKIPKIESFFI